MGRPLWVDDPRFNLEYHVRHTALPSPGSIEQLRKLAGRIFSQRLDRSKPLWELWLVQGLEDGRFAIINKTHHALVDGVSGVDITTVLFDTAPDPDARSLARAGRPRPSPADAALVAEGVKGIVGVPDAPGAAGARCGPAPASRPRRKRARGGRRPRQRGLEPREPRARDAPERADRPAPPGALAELPARAAEGDQERARRHGERRLPRSGVGGARPLAAPPRRAHRGTGAARHRPGVDPGRRAEGRARQPDHGDAGAAARLRRRTRSSATGSSRRR